MTTYYSTNELEAFKRRLSNYETEHTSWIEKAQADEERLVTEQAQYEVDHATWLELPTNESGDRVDANGLPVPEPQPPQPGSVPPEPEAPTNDCTIYNARELNAPEQLVTPEGTAIVMPPSIVMTVGEISFAITPEVLEASYTHTDTPFPKPYNE